MSPPHNNALLNQRDMLITQPSSIPSSPLGSPGAQSTSNSFCLQSALSNTNLNENDDPTTDPNWQATKPTVRERNAAMFNNELMADIKFVVGGDGESSRVNRVKIETQFPIFQNKFRRFQLTSTYWPPARRSSTRCSSVDWRKTNRKSLYLTWNLQHF
jgi:hypothetical protein